MQNVIDIRAWKAKKAGHMGCVLAFRKSSLEVEEFCKEYSIIPEELNKWITEVNNGLTHIFHSKMNSAQRLKATRELFHLEPAELASWIGIEENQLLEIEIGKRPLNMKNGVRLAIELSIDPIGLLFPINEPTPEDRYKVEVLYYQMRYPSKYKRQRIFKFVGLILTIILFLVLLYSLLFVR